MIRWLPLYSGLLALLTCRPAVAAASAASIRVRDVNGAIVRPLEGRHRRATVLFFIAHDCPIANSYAPEIGRICRRYASARIVFYVVYVESEIEPAQAKKHAEEFGYPCPALLDPAHKLVDKVGATVTPEVAVLSPDARVLYRGRIDDLYVDVGTRRYAPTRRDLRLVLDAVASGKPAGTTFTKAIGCFIPAIATGK